MKDALSWLLGLAVLAGMALNWLVRWPPALEPLVTAGLFVLVGCVLCASYASRCQRGLLAAIRRLARTVVFPFRDWVLLALAGLLFAFALGLVLESLQRAG